MSTTPVQAAVAAARESIATSASDPPVDQPQPFVIPSQPPSTAEFIDLPNGKELNESAAKRLAAAVPVRLIVVAGPVDSGKTTLLTSLYELFQWGPVAECAFAGSSTLPAFEQRCHLARKASENPSPDTQRTPYKDNEPNYLHLRIRWLLTPFTVTDFLFTDVSGEMFDQARNSVATCRELTFLRRATDLLLLLDGQHCVRGSERHSVVRKSRTLLQSFLDSEMLPRYCSVDVVWTKSDYFKIDLNKETTARFREEVEKDFRKTFSDRVGNLRFSEVAARPTEAPELRFGYGVAQLLREWMTSSPRVRKMKLLPPMNIGTRESELFARRYGAL